ncbi:hypothetical protein RB600_000608 [Gaeumannomyces tritici]
MFGRSKWTTFFVVLSCFVGCLSTWLFTFPPHIDPTAVVQSPTWQQAAAAKRHATNAKIPSEWRLSGKDVAIAKSRKAITGEYIEKFLDTKTLHITSQDAPYLIASMGNGTLTAVEVCMAFCKRAAIAHQMSGILLEILFDRALERAQELDHHYSKHGNLSGPLHGLPFTLKDQFHVKGVETTMGYVGWIGTFQGHRGTGKEYTTDSQIVRQLKSLGAVPIGKTTLVQGSWAPETNNNIAGYTWNPHNQRLSSGGSSGGEGAMQALKGSVFGIGTDNGGSVSMPSAMQGIYSLKPSAGRLSLKDAALVGDGQQVMPTVAGIMAPSLATVRLVFKSLVDSEAWTQDPYVLPIPYRSEKEYKHEDGYKPTFGIMLNDGIVNPHPPIARALRTVKAALEEAGYEVVNWHPPSNNNSNAIHGPIARGDGCPDVYKALQLSGEPAVPEIANLFPGGKLRPSIPLPVFQNLVQHMKSYRQEHNDYWRSTAGKTGTGRPVDAVISPVSPHTAVPPGKFLYGEYSTSINVLDLASIVIPITVANEQLDPVDLDFRPLTDKDELNMASYDPKVYDGTPASLQLFGRRLDEEGLSFLAGVVDEVLDTKSRKMGDLRF